MVETADNIETMAEAGLNGAAEAALDAAIGKITEAASDAITEKVEEIAENAGYESTAQVLSSVHDAMGKPDPPSSKFKATLVFVCLVCVYSALFLMTVIGWATKEQPYCEATPLARGNSVIFHIGYAGCQCCIITILDKATKVYLGIPPPETVKGLNKLKSKEVVVGAVYAAWLIIYGIAGPCI